MRGAATGYPISHPTTAYLFHRRDGFKQPTEVAISGPPPQVIEVRSDAGVERYALEPFRGIWDGPCFRQLAPVPQGEGR